MINLYGFFQFLYLDHPIVVHVLNMYGGVGTEEYAYNTIAATTMFGGRRFVSIFSGMHSYAIFNLLTLAVSIGLMKLNNRGKWLNGLAIASLIGSILGGLLSASKSFFFGALVFLIVYCLIERKSVGNALKVSFSLLLFIIITFLLYAESRIIRDLVNIVTSLNFSAIFYSRYSSEGYLRDVMAITFKPFTLMFGLGGEAFNYKYSDSQFRQVLLVGGILLFFVFYSFIAYLCDINYRFRKLSIFGAPFFSLGIALLFIGIGIAAHIQARIIPLWLLFHLTFFNRSRHAINSRL
ncbi:MAG: hypothetical protein ACE5H1_01620 [Thermodesulfobacteriota bacterium]